MKVLKVLGVVMLLASACRAGWLHRAYQGEFCDGDWKYAVSNDGKFALFHMEASSGGYFISGNTIQPAKPDWTYKFQLDDRAALEHMIADLQKVDNAWKAAEADDQAHQYGDDCHKPCKD